LGLGNLGRICIERLLRADVLVCFLDSQAKERSSHEYFFPKAVGQYKGTWYETARNLFRSRNTQHARAEKLAEENRQLRTDNETFRRELKEHEEQLNQTQQLLKQHKQENEQLRKQQLTLPSDLPLKHH
jgi:lipocalin